MLPWWPWASKPRVVTHAEHPPDQLDISVVIPALVRLRIGVRSHCPAFAGATAA